MANNHLKRVLILSLAAASSLLAAGPNSDASKVFPAPRQLTWQRREVTALVHLGPNTFTGREWGSGTESPAVFNPTSLDCAQWVEAAQAFGAKSITMTCKHHDGFCLWPSEYTQHSVKSSPWKNGQGDVVRELSDACRKSGLGFGIYLSPADLNHPDYGFHSARYNDYFCNQLRELLTGYGEICEVFLDGAQPSVRHQGYDFPRYYKLIRQLQPNAAITMRGPDARWVGNELGEGRDSEWSVIPVPMDPEQYTWPDKTAPDLGSRDRLRGAPFLAWHPAVAAVPLRRDWFWHPGKDSTVKSLAELLRIYELSVGRNAVLQLGLTPDRTGKIPESDLNRLREFGQALQTRFATDLVATGIAGTNSLVLKDDGAFEQRIAFASSQTARYLVLQEDITKGQRVESFELTVTPEGSAPRIIKGGTIGYKRIIHLGDTPIREMVLRIKQTRAEPFLTAAVY